MPVGKIRSSKRGIAAIVVIAAAITGGVYGTYDHKSDTVMINGVKIDPPVIMATELIVKGWEGLRTTAYLDTLPNPDVWTVGYGETRGVKKGDTCTPKECADMLMVRLQKDYYERIVACAPQLKEAPDGVQAAMASGAYNFGVGSIRSKRGWCGWSMSAKIRQKDWRGACERQTSINRSGGKIYQGLVNRREMGDKYRIGEAELCLSALEPGAK